MSLRELVDTYKELDEQGREDVRIEFEDYGDVETAIERVSSGSSSIWHLDARDLDDAFSELAREFIGCISTQDTEQVLLDYFDYERYGRDIVRAGDYNIIEFNNNFYAVSQH